MLDRQLVKLHSTFIRMRDADKNGICRCMTCPIRRPWKQMDAGHWQPRRHLGTRFHDKNVHAQCPRCNQLLGGRPRIQELAITDWYGKETAQKLKYLAANKTIRLDRGWYLDKIAHYKAEIAILKKVKNL